MWCAADTDLGFTRDRRSYARKSGKPDLRGPSRSVAVPDQRCTAPLRFALHRIRDTWVLLAPRPNPLPNWGERSSRTRGPQVGDGFIQSLPVFVGERGLDQSLERCAGIAAPEQARDHDHELVELGLPAFMSLAVAFDQASHARDLHGERII